MASTSLYLYGLADFSGSALPSDNLDRPALDFPVLVPDLPEPLRSIGEASAIPDAATVASTDGIAVGSAAAGARHFMFIHGGALYGFGSNAKLQIDAAQANEVNRIVKVDLPFGTPAVTNVACGALHTLIRCEDGRVLSCGANKNSQLGQLVQHSPADTKNVPDMKWGRVVMSEPAAKVYAAGNVSFALTADGRLFSWGSQCSGCLGHGTTGALERVRSGGGDKFEDVEHPTQVQWFTQHRVAVVDVALGPEHALIQTKDDVYTVGDGGYGKLGHNSVSSELLPRRVVFPPAEGQAGVVEQVVQVAASVHHSMCLKSNPDLGSVVYVWGNLGTAGASDTEPVRIRISLPNDITRVCAGPDLCYAIASTGEAYVWGRGRPSNYGASSRGAVADPTKSMQRGILSVGSMDGKFATDIVCGGSFAVFLADERRRVALDNMFPEHKTRHVTVPKEYRYQRGFSERLTSTRFEESTAKYWARCLGVHEDEIPEAVAAAEALRASNPQPSSYVALAAAANLSPSAEGRDRLVLLLAESPEAAEVPDTRKVLKKRGSSNLNIGSKVRVWMDDVYALGVVIAKPTEEYGAGHVEVRWCREDWDPEVVELLSVDETLDEDNDARWQNLWIE